MDQLFQERFSLKEMEKMEPIIQMDVTPTTQGISIEIHPENILNINPNIDPCQRD
jgi:hypothetical protein